MTYIPIHTEWSKISGTPDLFFRHEFLVVTVKEWLKLVYFYQSYRKNKSGVPLILDHPVHMSYFLAERYYVAFGLRHEPSVCLSVCRPSVVCDAAAP